MIMGGGLGTGGMYGQPYGQPGAMGSGMYSPAGQPQVNSWLMRGVTGPSFAPPAPAEAAAAWSNHASVAAQKAQHAYLDIEKVKADSIQRINDLNAKADTAVGTIKQLRDTYLEDLQKESSAVWNSYSAAKAAVDKMFKEAAEYSKSAYNLAQGTSDALRTQKFSAEISKLGGAKASSFVDTPPAPVRFAHKSDEEAVMSLVRKYMEEVSKGGQASKDIKSEQVAPIAVIAKTASTEHSRSHIAKVASDMKSASDKTLAGTPSKAQSLEFLTKAAGATLLQDTATAMNTQLKHTEALVEKLTAKELDAEHKILEAISSAQKDLLEGANIASKASIIAGKALAKIENFQQQSEYAQNAAGQAMAAQMAQAMGFPIAAKSVPSPFPPPMRAASYPFSGAVYSQSMEGVMQLLPPTIFQTRQKLSDNFI